MNKGMTLVKMENGIEVKLGWIVGLSRYSSIVEYFGKLDTYDEY